MRNKKGTGFYEIIWFILGLVMLAIGSMVVLQTMGISLFGSGCGSSECLCPDNSCAERGETCNYYDELLEQGMWWNVDQDMYWGWYQYSFNSWLCDKGKVKVCEAGIAWHDYYLGYNDAHDYYSGYHTDAYRDMVNSQGYGYENSYAFPSGSSQAAGYGAMLREALDDYDYVVGDYGDVIMVDGEVWECACGCEYSMYTGMAHGYYTQFEDWTYLCSWYRPEAVDISVSYSPYCQSGGLYPYTIGSYPYTYLPPWEYTLP